MMDLALGGTQVCEGPTGPLKNPSPTQRLSEETGQGGGVRGLVRGNPSPSLERACRYLGGGETSFRSQQDSRKSYGTASGPTSQPGCGYTVKVRMELDGVWWPQSIVWAL